LPWQPTRRRPHVKIEGPQSRQRVPQPDSMGQVKECEGIPVRRDRRYTVHTARRPGRGARGGSGAQHSDDIQDSNGPLTAEEYHRQSSWDHRSTLMISCTLSQIECHQHAAQRRVRGDAQSWEPTRRCRHVDTDGPKSRLGVPQSGSI